MGPVNLVEKGMDSSRGRNGIGAGRAGAVIAIVAGLVALPPAFAGEDPSAGAPPPDADGIVGNGSVGPDDARDPSGDPSGPGAGPAANPPAVAGTDGQDGSSGSEPDDDSPPADARPERAKAGPTTCPNTDAGAETLTNSEIEKSILCLVRQERKSHGRRKPDRDGDLDKVAGRHSGRMANQNCFEHKCKGESGLGKRIKRSGYTDGADRWRYNENLGCATTTQKMLDGWLNDASGDYINKRILLKRSWRDIGVGVAHGSPVLNEPVKCPDTNQTATYTLVWAFREG
jgi:uncharacterized protein YkwD